MNDTNDVKITFAISFSINNISDNSCVLDLQFISVI